ncbi:MAG TPA: DNA mismatch repair endonuclease MutL, partial [Pyrinomonadaceae bacterium]
HPRGTTIAVRDLFFNIPARRKFLRSEATETYHLTNLVTHYALAHPEIAFTFINNGREVVRAAPAKDLRERAYQIFGAEFLENLLEVNSGDAQVARVTGFVSAPRDRRTSRDSQYLFVNRRFVRDRMIGRSLSEGYRSILPHGVYPAALLFIETPLEEVDVNVHPAKTEVRFRRQAAVADAVREAVRAALASANFVPPPQEPEPIAAATAAVSYVAPQPRIEFVPPPPPPPVIPRAPIEPSGEEIARDIEVMIQSASKSVPSVAFPPLNSAEKLAREVTPETLSANIRPLGQLEESFIIATDDDGLLLIDQHVAHERVLFDKYRALEAERRTESQQLLVPETFDLTPAQAAVFDDLAPELEKYGFELMRLSGRTVAVKAIPADLPSGEARNMLAELLETVDAEKKSAARETLRDEIAASLACHAAIKVNMPLAPEKMRWLIDRLLLTSSPTTCPHGRPIILRLTTRDILKGFHRI